MPAPDTRTAKPPEAALLALIRERVGTTGALTVAAYMDLVLNHPELGYYHTRDPFGAAGDFVTAPEISQMFGEMIGAWLVDCWHRLGQPAPFRLVELGPGRGQLVADVVRTFAVSAAFLRAADVHLVESSRRLREIQRAKLPDLAITWHDKLEAVPEGPLFLIANEFFDALPVHQLIRTDASWVERLITTDDAKLTFTAGEAPKSLIDLIAGADAAEVGTVAEVSPARSDLARQIGERIVAHGGAGLIIDYGAAVDRPTGDTLQAVHRHRSVDPLAHPGEADLTTQVEFASLARAAASTGVDIHGPVPQGAFLNRLGLGHRALALLQQADERQADELRRACFRLTDASAMGELFKAMALTPPDVGPPAGFDLPMQAVGDAGS